MNQYELIANLNHDLRSPICTVNNLLYLLRREISVPAQLRMLNDIETAHDEIQSFLNNLLDFSKMQTGALSTHLEHFSVLQLFSQLRFDFKHLAQSKNILLSFTDQTDQLIDLYGDKSLIHKALHHVLGLVISSSHYSQISVDSEFSHEQTLHLKILFQGSIEDNLTLIQYFSADFNQLNLAGTPKTDTDLRLSLCKAFLTSLNAEIVSCMFDSQTSHFIIQIPMPPVVPNRV